MFKTKLRELWSRDYTGDGLWGRGQTLLSGQYDTGSNNFNNESIPARSLCGGTFRSRGRGRKRKRKMGIMVGDNTVAAERISGGGGGGQTYAEAQKRRIAKKFGVNGATLGGDEERRIKLEYGQKVKGKPRVANSARGRELRVAAAAARFGQQQQGETQKQDGMAEQGVKGKGTAKEKEMETERRVGSGSKSEIDINPNDKNDDEDEYEYEYEEVDEERELEKHTEQPLNPDGTPILDRTTGQSMIKVSSSSSSAALDHDQVHKLNQKEDDSYGDSHIKEELDELQELNDCSLPARERI